MTAPADLLLARFRDAAPFATPLGIAGQAVLCLTDGTPPFELAAGRLLF